MRVNCCLSFLLEPTDMPLAGMPAAPLRSVPLLVQCSHHQKGCTLLGLSSPALLSQQTEPPTLHCRPVVRWVVAQQRAALSQGFLGDSITAGPAKTLPPAYALLW